MKPIGHYSIEAGSNSIERYFAKYLLEEQGTSFEITAKAYDINSNFYELQLHPLPYLAVFQYILLYPQY